jgi:hypothetical protein
MEKKCECECQCEVVKKCEVMIQEGQRGGWSRGVGKPEEYRYKCRNVGWCD